MSSVLVVSWAIIVSRCGDKISDILCDGFRGLGPADRDGMTARASPDVSAGVRGTTAEQKADLNGIGAACSFQDSSLKATSTI